MPYISNGDIYTSEFTDLTGWTTTGSGNGTTTQVTFDGKSCAKLDSGAISGYALCDRDVGTFSGRTVVSYMLYYDSLGTYANSDKCYVATYGPSSRGCPSWQANDALYLYKPGEWVYKGNYIVLDTWQEWTYDINWTNDTVDVYIDKILVSSQTTCTGVSANTNGLIHLLLYSNTGYNSICYIDWIKVGSGFQLTNIKKYMGELDAHIKKVNGTTRATAKTIMGVA